MVSNAFTRLPLSTEQILHPEKYFNYERPIKIVLPDVTNLLNAKESANGKQQTANSRRHSTVPGKKTENCRDRGRPARLNARKNIAWANECAPPRASANALPTANSPLPTAGWHRIESDVNGEWTYYLILDQFLKSQAESKRAAAGWAGDRFALYEGPNGQVFLAQLAAWDTESDAREFFDAYVKRTELRYPGSERIDSAGSQQGNSKPETRNRPFLFVADERRQSCYRTPRAARGDT